MASYKVENQWGGSNAPWHPGGTWVLGDRPGQNVVEIDIVSHDDGQSFTGTMRYTDEGSIGFKAQRTGQNQYRVENQWGGNSAPWHPGGVWTIGAREGQNVVQLKLTSDNKGDTLTGTSTYQGEGPIGFRGALE